MKVLYAPDTLPGQPQGCHNLVHNGCRWRNARLYGGSRPEEKSDVALLYGMSQLIKYS